MLSRRLGQIRANKGPAQRVSVRRGLAGQKSWNGVAILARGAEPVETRRSPPGDRPYIEAAVGGLLVGCLYLPNGNPAPGPKFDYKLRLFERLTGYSKSFGQRRAGSDLVRNRKFESIPLQQRVGCEPHSSIVIGADELEACCERPPPLRVA